MSHLFSARSALLAFAGAAALFTTPALAQTEDAVPSVVVRYGDLNLGDPAGAQAMAARIDRAATLACGGAPNLRDLGRLAAYDHCKAAAVHRTVSQLDAPLVTAAAHQAGLSTLAQR